MDLVEFSLKARGIHRYRWCRKYRELLEVVVLSVELVDTLRQVLYPDQIDERNI